MCKKLGDRGFYTSVKYVKCSKILNIFDFMFSNKIWVIKAEIHIKRHIKIANREDPDQTASSEAV